MYFTETQAHLLSGIEHFPLFAPPLVLLKKIMMKKLFTLLLAFMCFSWHVQALDEDTSSTTFTYVDSLTGDTNTIDLASIMSGYSDSVNATFEYQYGTISIGDGIATLQVPEGFKYLNPERSSYVLHELWGNPESETMGLLFPENMDPLSMDLSYAVEISFTEDGYVEDDDAEDMDYDDLLEEMQDDTELASEQRVKMGYETVELIGWASRPFYDSENKKLHWAKELKFGEAEDHTLNYDVRVLGRRGYLTMSAIGDMEALPLIQQDLDAILGSVEFNEGHAYEDFDSSVDKVAAYGIGGLIAGKILAKAGFFALILKFWKVIAIAVAGFFAAFKRKIFGSKHKDTPLE